MRLKFLLCLIVVTGALSTYAQQITNNGFETWTGAVPPTPVNWDSYDRIVQLIGGGAIPVQPWCTKETTPANVFSGTASCKLRTDTTAQIGLIQGSVFWGSLIFNGQQPQYLGTPFTGRPLTFTGAINFAPVGSDTAAYSAVLTKWDATGDSEIVVAFDNRYVISTGGAYGVFVDTLVYLSAATPDTAYVQFASGYSNYSKVGTTLWVDSVSFLGTAAATNLALTLSKTDVGCYGQNSGSATATPTGASNYNYNWSNGGTTQTISGLTAGTYTVTVNSSAGSITGSVNVNQPVQLIASVSTTSSTCGTSTGSAWAVASGGNSSTYTYLWSYNGSHLDTLLNLPAGPYSVTVNDNGCSVVATGTVTNANGPTVAFTNNQPTCFFSTNGSIIASVSGGSAPYTYSWQNHPGTTGDTLANIGAGTYYLTVTDNNGCTAPVSDSLSQPNFVGDYLQSTPSSGSNGTAWASPSGGTPPYTITWSNGGTTDTITGLAPGNYSITVTDSHGCNDTRSVTVASGSVTLNIAFSNTQPQCFQGTDGVISVTVTGGTSPYTYAWQGGSTANPRTGIAAGTYTVTVTDNNNNTASASNVLAQPTFVSNTISTTPSSGNNGTATVTASGGTPPYTYAWTGGQTTATATGFAPGTYTVTVTDSHGCTDNGTATIILTGINEPGKILTAMSVYPNPANEQLILAIELQQANNLQVRITDMTGKVVYTANESGAGKFNHTINTQGFSAGMYVMEVTAGNDAARTRFVVTH